MCDNNEVSFTAENQIDNGMIMKCQTVLKDETVESIYTGYEDYTSQTHIIYFGCWGYMGDMFQPRLGHHQDLI